MGIAVHVLLGQPFVQHGEKRLSLTTDMRSVCLPSLFFTRSSHVLFLCNLLNPWCALCLLISPDSCVYCYASDIVGFGVWGFFSCCVLIVTFIISFMHFWENFQGM